VKKYQEQEQEKILIAKAMGDIPYGNMRMNAGFPKSGPWVDVPYSGFSPHTKADDTEKVIDWLQETHRFRVTVSFGRGVRFDHYIGTHVEVETDDWKAAICELAAEL